MRKNIFFALLVMGTTSVYGMDPNEVEHSQTKMAKRVINATIYALSLDWCENQLGMGVQLALECLDELNRGCKKIGVDCDPESGRVQRTCAVTVLCCAGVGCVGCMKCPLITTGCCTVCGLTARKLYVMRNYGFSYALAQRKEYMQRKESVMRKYGLVSNYKTKKTE